MTDVGRKPPVCLRRAFGSADVTVASEADGVPFRQDGPGVRAVTINEIIMILKLRPIVRAKPSQSLRASLMDR